MTEGALRLKLPLSDEAIAEINDLAGTGTGKEDVSPSRWCFRQIAASVKENAPYSNRLRISGRVEITPTRAIRPSDLRQFPLESYTEGTVEVFIGPRIREGIERSCAFLDAAQRAAGGPPLAWNTSREWCLRIVQEAIAKESAKQDGTDIETEEKELYDPPETPKK